MGTLIFLSSRTYQTTKIADVAIVNAMLVRGSGAIESIATVPAMRAKDAVPQMKKAQEMAAAMVYEAPTKS